MEQPIRILVVADCSAVAYLVEDMRWHGFDAHAAKSGTGAMEEYADYDVLLLDVDLPDLDGLAVCRTIRATSDIPIIGFTSQPSELDQVLCLEAGCDDCIEKPYRSRELVARINAVMRRVRVTDGEPGRQDGQRLSLGPLSIDSVAREVRLHDRLVGTTRKEFDLLRLLAAEPEKVFSREELMTEIWDHPAEADVSPQASRTIDTHVSSLRGKLGGGGWITTVRGVGFRFGGP
ncbi:response regulator transcription factor [Actinomadura craniellae]|uniref:response regulator transcription factor n=1 Tax=Actinomadura craniellae TaxID=2231787 RepID=UPI001F4778E7|nr:winged helix-turn-helix domain-containing protein [Actinomadura craniellae]